MLICANISSLLIKIFVPGNTQLLIKLPKESVCPTSLGRVPAINKSDWRDNLSVNGLLAPPGNANTSDNGLTTEPVAANDLPPAIPPDTNVTSLSAIEPENTAREAVISTSDDVTCVLIEAVAKPKEWETCAVKVFEPVIPVLTSTTSAFSEAVPAP